MNETYITPGGEHSMMFIGLGGQGIQLAGKILARACVNAGMHVMLSADYGGEMRGGPSNTSLVFSSNPVGSLPILPRVNTAVVAHPKFSGTVPERLDDDGILLLNESVAERAKAKTAATICGIEATRIAMEVGASQATGLVLLGAINKILNIVETDALVAAMESAVPPHRSKLVPLNREALRSGAQAGEDCFSALPASTTFREMSGSVS